MKCGNAAMQHMESLKREIEKLTSDKKHGSSGRMLEEVDKYRKANDALHATVARLEASSFSYQSITHRRCCAAMIATYVFISEGQI